MSRTDFARDDPYDGAVTEAAQMSEPPLLESIAPRRLPDVIAEQIVEAIRKGALKPGDRLPTEQVLARQLGVGRTSVREGLQKLQTLGLIDVRKGRGAFVAERDQADATEVFARWTAEYRFAIEELLEVRIALESQAAGIAAVRAAGSQLDELDRLHRAHRLAGEQRDTREIVGTDERFHEAVFEASGNRLLTKMYHVLIPELTEFRQKSLALPWAPERSARGHAVIVDAIRKRDPAAARSAMIDHLWVLYGEVHETAARQGSAPLDLAPRDALG